MIGARSWGLTLFAAVAGAGCTAFGSDLCEISAAYCSESSAGASGTGGGGSGAGPGGSAGTGGGCVEPLSMDGTSYFVDAACTVDGDGSSEQCAVAEGEAGAFRDPQRCFNEAGAGDTCVLAAGTYVATRPDGFVITNSGTQDAPLRIRAHPGQVPPLLSNCDPTDTTRCDRPTITAVDQSYVVFDCLHVRGGYSLRSEVATPAQGLVIRYGDVSQGWSAQGDGNWSGIWLSGVRAASIHHNVIHDVALPADEMENAASCIGATAIDGSLIEHNTCRSVTNGADRARGISVVSSAGGNEIARNRIEGIKTCFYAEGGASGVVQRFANNVCVATEQAGQEALAVQLDIGVVATTISNNTLSGFSTGLYVGAESVSGVEWYNNIVAKLSSGAPTNLDVGPDMAIARSNFNTWMTNKPFKYAGVTYSALAAFSDATMLDQQSQDEPCNFVDRDSDFHLQRGSPCAGAGREGGVSSGAPVDQGAYGGVDVCVGHECPGAEP